jgi:hypothetical protein
MHKKFLFLFFVLIFSACTDTDVIPIPDSVLPEEKMAEIFVDLNLLEATLNIHAGNINSLAGNSSKLKVNFYSKHQVSKEQFDESYKFYTENPELLVEIYTLVLNNLSRMQAQVSGEK